MNMYDCLYNNSPEILSFIKYVCEAYNNTYKIYLLFEFCLKINMDNIRIRYNTTIALSPVNNTSQILYSI